MENIDLAKLFPKCASFKLSQVPDREFRLKACTPGIVLEIDNNFGSMESLINRPDAKNIAKLALSLMYDEDKLFFAKRKVKTININTGAEIEKEMGGIELFMNLISLSITELYDVYAAILSSIGLESKEVEGIINTYKDGINKVVNNQIDKNLKKKKKVKKKK